MSAQYERQDIRQLASGKERSLLVAAGISESVLNGKHQPCPMCGGVDRFRFDNKDGRGSYICGQCGSGDFVNLLMNHLSTDFVGVLDFVKDNLGVVKMDIPRSAIGGDYLVNRSRLDNIKACCVKITDGDPVYLYLRKRGINILPHGAVMYHPAIDYWEDGKKTGTHPAMVACIMNNAMERVTYKITYLTPDGLKADVPAHKKLMPTEREILGASVRMFRFTDTLAVAEGIETALAYTQETGIPCWSADTAGNLQKFDIPKGLENLVIVSDGDFIGKQAAYTLAVRAARTVKVNVVFPLRINAGLEYITDMGKKIDFNDMLK